MKIRRVMAVLTIAVAAAAAPVDGQVQGKLFGLTGGATLTNLSGVSSDWLWSPTVGVYAGVQTWSFTIVNLEVNYARRGIEAANTSHVEIPVLFGGVVRRGNVRIRGYTGLRLGFEVSCNDDDSFSTNLVCDRSNSTQWAWPFGVQIGRTNANGTTIAFDARYAWGISDAYRSGSWWHQGWEFKVVLGKVRP
jgi:hypothetical protein